MKNEINGKKNVTLFFRMWVETCALLALVVPLLYAWLAWNYKYWKRHRVVHPEPSLIFGNLKEIFLMSRPYHDVYGDIYK